MHLRQPGFTYSVCGIFKKNKERIQKPKQTKDSGYIYQKELDKGCFQRYMVYRDFKEILSDKAFTMLKIQNMMDIKGVLLRWLIFFFQKKTNFWWWY